MSAAAAAHDPPDSLQIHALTAHPASNLVRGADGRPKTVMYGGVERARVSSAALKRAVRTSEAFRDRFEGRLGTRTRRFGDLVAARLAEEGAEPARAASAVAAALGVSLAHFGKPDDENPGRTKQVAFVAPEEVEALAAVARVVLAGGKAASEPVKPRDAVAAVDVALFGRMFAGDKDARIQGSRMTAAAEVAHPFTVGKAVVEADFYTAVDDQAVDDDDTASGFLGEHFFTAGLFYAYARIDMRQLARNLGGDRALAADAAAAFVEALATVSPSGKRASHGTHARAAWLMVERGPAPPTSLATAFLRPVSGEDQLAEAKGRALDLAEAFDRAYGTRWERRVMDVAAGTGTLAGLAALAGAEWSPATA